MLIFLTMYGKHSVNIVIIKLPLKMVHVTEAIKQSIITLRDAGFTNYAIAKQLNIDKNTVARWIRRYNENQNLERKPGQGRKRKTDVYIDRIICRAVRNNRFTTAAAILNDNILPDISEKP